METADLIQTLRGFAVGTRAVGYEVTADMVTMAADRLESLVGDIETLTRINEDWKNEVARLYGEITKARDLGANLAGVAAGSQAPGSNYQKILRMGPWEMATWIMGTGTVCDCCDRHGSCGIPEEEVTDVYCLEHIMRWLSEEVQNGND